ncbi:MAG: aminotransferase class V-fold PLP-dependent enzyme [Gemmataceae bacterium]
MTSRDFPLPALLGGPPVRPQGPPSWPAPDEDVLAALQQAYADGSWGKYHGPAVKALEERLAEYHGVAHAVLCASGTLAVEIALRGFGVIPGREVIMSAYDYPGNFLSVHALGARPVLVDVRPENLALDVALLEEAVSPGASAIVVSHLHGGVVPMRRLMDFAERRRIPVLEDAAQAPGGRVDGRRAGTWGELGVISFGGSKLLSAGRGGAILTNRPDWHQRIRLLLQRGVNHLATISELQATVLLPQLAKLDARNRQRRDSVERLRPRLERIPGLGLLRNEEGEHEPGYYKLGLRLDAARFGLAREKVVTAMRAEGIALDEGFAALHVGRSPNRYKKVSELDNAAAAQREVMILHHPVLLGSTADLDEIALAFEKVHYHRRLFDPS